jgi:anti-sigma regulatory factor (Ser/Thr protein kinase)
MCELFDRVRILLPVEAASVPRARHLITDAGCPRQDADARDRAALLISELVTNAIKHGTPPIQLEISCEDGGHALQVRVTDGSRRMPSLAHARPLDESGRGLELTAVLSDEWGVEATPPGKTVWFKLSPA